jgi:hypothetical protein
MIAATPAPTPAPTAPDSSSGGARTDDQSGGRADRSAACDQLASVLLDLDLAIVVAGEDHGGFDGQIVQIVDRCEVLPCGGLVVVCRNEQGVVLVGHDGFLSVGPATGAVRRHIGQG